MPILEDKKNLHIRHGDVERKGHMGKLRLPNRLSFSLLLETSKRAPGSLVLAPADPSMLPNSPSYWDASGITSPPNLYVNLGPQNKTELGDIVFKEMNRGGP